MTDRTDVVQRARQALDGITPGPWTHEISRWVGSKPAGCAIVGAHGEWIAEDVDEEADIRFIAAAPDLVRELADEAEKWRAERNEAQAWAAWFAAEREYVRSCAVDRIICESNDVMFAETQVVVLEAERDELRAEVEKLQFRLNIAMRRGGYDLEPEARELMRQAIPSWANARGVVERCLADVRAANEERDELRATIQRVRDEVQYLSARDQILIRTALDGGAQ